MDFSKFRDSGDLSDIVVVVEGQENHLHRFPLYAKSDYFCSVARGPALTPSPSSTNKCRVELKDFPGGQEVFSVVADFCYNMAPRVTKDNVVQLRCAAKFLQMTGPGNLAEAADRYLQDILTSAKLSRSFSPLISLLLQCAGVGQLAADCGVVDTCTDALVETLLKSPTKFAPPAGASAGGQNTGSGAVSAVVTSSGGSAFTSLQGSAFTPTKPSQTLTVTSPLSSSAGKASLEDHQLFMKNLCQLPEDWFANLLKKCMDRGVLQSLLADMAVTYVSQAIDRDSTGGEGTTTTTTSNNTTTNTTNNTNNDANNTGSSPAPLRSGSAGGLSVEAMERDVREEVDLDKDIDSLGGELEEIASIGEESPRPLARGADPLPVSLPPRRPVDLGQLLDAVLTTLPEEAYVHVPSLTLEWLTKVLRIATARGCRCRQFLVKIAADMLSRLPAEELCLVSPSVLHDIVLEAKADDSQTERACLLVDTYLAEMAKKGVLTAETFRLLADATPADARRNHDNLYVVLEYVLKSEKDSLSTEQHQELLSTINLDLVSEDTLQRALDSNLVSAEPVARAALRLCGTLRSELESVKYIAQMQEEELQKHQARMAAVSVSVSSASPQGSPRSGTVGAGGVSAFVAATLKMDSDSGFSDNNQDSKTSPDGATATDHVRAAQSVLSAARSKLAMPLYTGHRPYLPSSSGPSSSSSSAHPSHHASSLAYPLASGAALEHDISLQEELDYRLDRSSFRSLDPRVRTRHYPTTFGGHHHTSGSSSSSHHGHHGHHRSTYFPYSPRF